MPGQLKVDEIVDTAGTGPVTALNGLKADSLTNIAGTAGYPLMRLETAKTATGTSVDFTGIPSWAKKITVMLNGVSTNGTSYIRIRVGATVVDTTGYSGASTPIASGVLSVVFTSGFDFNDSGAQSAADIHYGLLRLVNLGSNSWVADGTLTKSNAARQYLLTGGKTLASPLDIIRITTINGTDAFDAGTINILIEGY